MEKEITIKEFKQDKKVAEDRIKSILDTFSKKYGVNAKVIINSFPPDSLGDSGIATYFVDLEIKI